jgi:hypothetical protein
LFKRKDFEANAPKSLYLGKSTVCAFLEKRIEAMASFAKIRNFGE